MSEFPRLEFLLERILGAFIKVLMVETGGSLPFINWVLSWRHSPPQSNVLSAADVLDFYSQLR